MNKDLLYMSYVQAYSKSIQSKNNIYILNGNYDKYE
jgi:hypothetical protein